MKSVTVFRILLVSLAIMLGAYLVISMMDTPTTNQNSQPVQNTGIPTPRPSTLTKYQACVDRANNSEAEQTIINEAIRKCEESYKP